MSGEGALQRFKGGLTVGALITAAVAVAFGTGFTASRTILGDGGAWLSSDRGVSHVNSGTRRTDARIDENLVTEVGGQEVVTSSSGVAVVDTTTGVVTSLDTTTMTPGSRAQAPEGEGRTRFVVAGRWGYLVGNRLVQPVDPVTLQREGPDFEFGHVAGAVATAEGTLMVLDAEDGTVTEVVPRADPVEVEVARRAGRQTLALTAVSGRPVVVDTEAGTVRRLRPGGVPEDAVEVPGLAGVDVAQVAVADPQADGATIWLARRDQGELVGVDLDIRSIRSASLGGRDGQGLQAPVVFQGMVYVPHGGSHDVTVMDASGRELRRLDQRLEPEGTGARLEVFVQDGRVWINDPGAATALVVGPEGRDPRRVDKGTGRTEEPGEARDPGPGPSRPDGPTQPAPGPTPQPGSVPRPGPTSGQPPAGPAPGPQPPLTSSPDVPVPDVVGLDHEDACGRIESAGLVCHPLPQQEAPDDVERDEVMEQNPASGTRQPAFSRVTVEYYAPGRVRVPDVTGQRVANGGDPLQGPACQDLIASELTCEPEQAAPMADQPADVVLPNTQRPAGDAREHRGETVTFEYAPTAPAPDVGGLREADACARIEALNLVCNRTHLPRGANPGVVQSQDPAPGVAVAADGPVTVVVPDATPIVPDLTGQDYNGACTLLAAQDLPCPSWQANVNSIRAPGRVDAQSPAPGTPIPPGTQVAAYYPAGPDVTLHRFRAYTAGGQPMERWAMAPDGGPGRNVYDMFVGPQRASLWRLDGTIGRCYSSQVEGSWPLYAFMEASRDDPDHEQHFYATNYGTGPDSQWQRAHDYYGPPTGILCYVIPWDGTPGATHVFEWWKGQDHYYGVGAGAGPPGTGYTEVRGHWMTWP